jgi:nitrogen-specific signal transduction histidine kinase
MQMRVEDSGHRRTHAVHLSIQDSGRGFPQDLHTVCKANSGIAIVKELIARLNGEINFASEPNAQIRIIVPNISPNIGYT